jgi:uncharacterized protein (TIGR02246 family)
MISKILTLLVLGTFAFSQEAPKPVKAVTPAAAIRAVIDRQQLDWNRGDTEGFLTGYDKDATFVSNDKISKGLEELRVRYQSHYPTRSSMGHLTFSDLDVRMIGTDHALVIGRWRLERKPEDGGDTGGVFTLLFTRTPRGWKITVDHTS